MTRQSQELCVFGVGGVGGYFGGRLAWWLAGQADPAWHVHFVARGAHLAAIRSSGLVLNTPEARLVCTPASASGDMQDMPAPDIVLLCVKSYDLDAALRQVAERCHPDTALIPLLNGVDIHARIRAHLPEARVLPACVFVGTHLDGPGEVTQRGGDGVIVVGADPDHPGYVPEDFLALLGGARVRYRWCDDARPAVWEKFVFIAAFGLVTAASRKSLGEVLGDERLLADARGIMDEVVALAEREGVALDPQVVAHAMVRASGFPFETRTSFQRDVEAGGPDEGGLFGGTILRLGKRLGVPTPTTDRVCARVVRTNDEA